MKILLVNQTFYPDNVSTAQHLIDFAAALRKDGHQVAVLTSRRGYSAPYPDYPASENYQGIRIIRVWPFMFGRKNRLIRSIDALCVNLAFFFKMLVLPRADIIVALTSPPLVSFFACLAAQFRKSRLVYWVMDMNPDEAIAMGWIREASMTARLLRRCQSFVVKHSGHVVVLDKYMRERLILADVHPANKNNKYLDHLDKKLETDKVRVNPPWSHDEDLEVVAHENNPFREKYGLCNKFVVMYSGNHSVCHPLDTVLETARLFAKDNDVIFLFIGGGVRVQDVIDFKTKYELNNIIQMDYIARPEIRFSLSAADLHIVVMGENMAGIVHPCKVYGILALGRPFVYVGPPRSHIVDLIHQGAVGYSVRHGEAEKLAAIIRQSQCATSSELHRITLENRAVAERFSTKALVPKLVATVINLEPPAALADAGLSKKTG